MISQSAAAQFITPLWSYCIRCTDLNLCCLAEVFYVTVSWYFMSTDAMILQLRQPQNNRKQQNVVL